MTLAILLRAEVWKLVRRWFFVAAVLVVFLGSALWGPFEAWARRADLLDGPYRTIHTLQIFLFSFRAGLFLSTVLSMLCAALMFCSEFDNGTIKGILTRPVARWEVYLAKSLVAVAFYAGLVGIAILAGLLVGSLRGNLGPIWDPKEFTITSTQAQAWATVWKLLAVSVPAGLAVVGLGLCVSAWIDHSGFAVGLAILVLLLAYAGTPMLPEGPDLWVFPKYPRYAFETAGVLLEGGADLTWRPEEVERLTLGGKVWLPRYVFLPLLYMLGAVAASYPRFHWRDIFA